MRWLGPILLVAVFLRHDTAQWLPWYSPSEWFYILGGMWEAVLCFALLVIIRDYPLAIAALWIGILEGSQVAICGAVIGHRRAPAGMNDCDYLAGLPIGAIMTGLYLYIVCRAIGQSWAGYFGAGHEIALGVTLAVIVTIGGNEVGHLVSPWAALLVMTVACVAAIMAYKRAI